MNKYDLDDLIATFEDLEEFIRVNNLEITIMEDDVDGIHLGLDVPQNPAYFQRPIHDLINILASPETDFLTGGCVLVELEDIADNYPALLYVCTDSLEEGLQKLDERVQNWVKLSQKEKEQIFEKVNEIHSKFYDSIVYFLWN